MLASVISLLTVGSYLPFQHGQWTQAALPAGTKISIRLSDVISTETNSSGDFFQATLDGPLREGAKTLAPSGSAVEGELVDVDRGRADERAKLTLLLRTLTVEKRLYLVAAQPLTLTNPDSSINLHSADGVAGGRRDHAVYIPNDKCPVAYGPDSRLTFNLADPLLLRVRNDSRGTK